MAYALPLRVTACNCVSAGSGITPPSHHPMVGPHELNTTTLNSELEESRFGGETHAEKGSAWLREQ